MEEEKEGRKIVKGEGGQKGNGMSWEGGAGRWEEGKGGDKAHEEMEMRIRGGRGGGGGGGRRKEENEKE